MVARVAQESIGSTSEQNRYANESKADRDHGRSDGHAIAACVLRPFLPNIEESRDQKKIGDAQGKGWLRKNEERQRRRETRYKNQPKTREGAVKVLFVRIFSMWAGDVSKNGLSMLPPL